MKLNLRKLFGKESPKYFSFSEEPDFTNGYEFLKVDDVVVQKLKQALTELESDCSEFNVEPFLEEKKMYEFGSVEELITKVIDDLDTVYNDYTTEFEGDSLRFRFIIGKELILPNSVNIVQRIFDSRRNDIGDILYMSVIRYKKNRFIYWPWD